jgi:methylmalonyl-CoA mutase N-terminal domain/subunit
VKDFYCPEDLLGFNYDVMLGNPGIYPYTRGIYPNMYKGRLWTMRQYAGYGDAHKTNERFHYLLKQGQTGLSVAFDLPTQLGYDSDSIRALGEVGKVGVAISTIDDMRELFHGIPLDKVSTSMTINATAPVILAMYIGVANENGISPDRLSGTVQNDILKEYIARGNYIFPVRPSLKLAIDIWEYAIRHLPRWYFVSISGYHIREAGATAIEELSLTFANAICYIEEALRRGLKIDDIGSRLSFFFGAHNDFFEEIAKFRAARRIWARIMRERFKARDPKSWMMRFHTQTCGSTLTAQEPENNIIRVTLQALASILGGTQSLHTNSYDEALALPSEEAVKIALRIQQIIAYESKIPEVADPLGGSYYLETLTNEIEDRVKVLIDEIENMGGAIKCIEEGIIQKRIEESAFRFQQEIEAKTRKIVGVNILTVPQNRAAEVKILKVSPRLQEKRKEQLKIFRTRRNKNLVKRSLEGLRKAVERDKNIFEEVLECVKNNVTLEEICNLLREIYGEYDTLKR